MLALTISDVKDFMNKLLIGEVFDNFSLVEASVTTFNTFTIDGHLQQDFFDTDTVEEYKKEAVEYSLWRDVKPYCFSIIRGKRTPLNFKIVFQLSSQLSRQCRRFPSGRHRQQKVTAPDLRRNGKITEPGGFHNIDQCPFPPGFHR